MQLVLLRLVVIPLAMNEYSTIPISLETKKKLDYFVTKRRSYDELISFFLKHVEHCDTAAEARY